MITDKQFQSAMSFMRDLRKKHETIYYRDKEVFAVRVGTDFIELEDGTRLTKDNFRKGNYVLQNFYVKRGLNEI